MSDTASVAELLEDIEEMVIAGFTGRNQEEIRAHIDELAAEGIPAPDRIPSFYSVPIDRLTTEEALSTTSEQSSGEVEPVLLFVDGAVWLTVGSDHTARDVEREGIEASKRACAKVLGRTAVRCTTDTFDFDALRLESWARHEGEWLPYQSGDAGQILPPESLLNDPELGGARDGLALFLGTIALKTETFVFADAFSARLEHPSWPRPLTLDYKVDVISPSRAEEPA